MDKKKIESLEVDEVQKEYEEYSRQYFSKDLISINAGMTKRRRKYTRQQVRNFLRDPFQNYDKLQDVSEYLKAVSGNYFRILKYLSGLSTLDHMIYPNSKSKIENGEKVKKDFLKAAQLLEKMKVKHNFRWIFERMIENGEVFLYKIEDGKGIVYKEIPHGLCRISSIDNGVFRYDVNVANIQEQDVEYLPMEMQSAWKSPNSQVDGWYTVSEKGFAFNVLGNYTNGFPMLSFMFDDVMGLEDTKDLMEDKTKLDAIKLVHQKIPMDKDGNKPVFDMLTARMFHEGTKKNLPTGVAVTTNPLDITAIPFDKAASTEFDSVERSERNIWNSSGISDLIFSNQKASGEAMKRSIIADETLVMPFLTMFEHYINSELESTKFSFEFLETSYFNREEKIATGKEMLAYGSSRLHLLATMGFTPIQVINIFEFEQNILNIDEMLVPKQTSHTMAGDEEGKPGAPTQEEKGEEVAENTELDRDSK